MKDIEYIKELIDRVYEQAKEEYFYPMVNGILKKDEVDLTKYDKQDADWLDYDYEYVDQKQSGDDSFYGNILIPINDDYFLSIDFSI